MAQPQDETSRHLHKVRPRRISVQVECVFDPAKDAANLAKHGVSLGLAPALFAGPSVSVVDDRMSYGEVRNVAFGRIAGRMFVCVYTERDGRRRIISLRKANNREVARYGTRLEQRD